MIKSIKNFLITLLYHECNNVLLHREFSPEGNLITRWICLSCNIKTTRVYTMKSPLGKFLANGLSKKNR